MTELSISADFLSKENSTQLYKNFISKNKLDNSSKKEKEKYITDLIEIMKKKYKILELNKINKSNINQVKIQFNDICLKELQTTVNVNKPKNIIKDSPDDLNINHDRKFNRDFNSIKKKVTISERPVGSSFNNDNYAPINLPPANNIKLPLSNNINQPNIQLNSRQPMSAPASICSLQ